MATNQAGSTQDATTTLDEFTRAMADPGFLTDPYPTYDRLRSADPVHRTEGGWFLTRFDDVAAVVRDHDRFSNDPRRFEAFHNLTQADSPEAINEVLIRSMIRVDPPDHTRLRGLVRRAFTPRRVAELRPSIQQIADDLLDAVADDRRMDVMEAFATPLPVTVICELLGIPRGDRPTVRDLARQLIEIRREDPTKIDPEMLAVVNRVGEQLRDYFLELVRERRAHPTDDLVGGLVEVEEAGDQLSENELLGTCLLLLLAGHITTINLIGNGLLALLRHPGQWEMLRENPSLTPHAVEELLRYDSPVQMVARTPIEEVELDGKRLKPGEMVLPLLGAANRDPGHYPDPGTLDLARTDVDHLAFGAGIHFCLGAPLARLEGDVAFRTLPGRFPNLRLETEEEPERIPTFGLRGLKALHVCF